MQAPRLTDVLARVVAWHNRHPLARRIQPHQVHSIGEVRLPFAATRAPATPWLDTPGDAGPGPTLAEALAQRAAAAPAGPGDTDTNTNSGTDATAPLADDGRATTLALSADEAAALFAPSEAAASRIEDALADELAGALSGPASDPTTEPATDRATDDAPPAANDAAPTTTVDDAADLFGAATDAAPEPEAQAEAQATTETETGPAPDGATDADSSDPSAEASPSDPDDLADAAPELELGTEDLPATLPDDTAVPAEAAADGGPGDAPSSPDSTGEGTDNSADSSADNSTDHIADAATDASAPTADAAAPSALAAALAARRPAAAAGADTAASSDTALEAAPPAAPPDAAAAAEPEHAATTAAATTAATPVPPTATANAAAPAAAATGLSALGRLRTLFSERFLWPVSPWRIARWAQRHGQLAPLAPVDWPHRTVQTDPTLLAASRQKGLAHTVQLHVLTAGIGVGDRRLRLLIGADGAVLGRRAYSPLRMALAGAVLLAAVAGASWPLWHRTHAATGAHTEAAEAADAAAAAASAASDSASSAAPEASAPASDAAAHGHDEPASAPADGHAAAPEAAAASATTDAHGAAPAASEPDAAASAADASASQATVFRLKRARTQRASEPLAQIRPRLSDDEKQAAREASAIARGDKPAPAAVVYAVVTRAAPARAASEAGLAAMRAASGKLLPPVPDHMEVLPMGNQWRAAWWPFTSLADADRVRVMLIGRGVQAEVVEF